MRAAPKRDDAARWNAAKAILKGRDYKNGRPCCRMEIYHERKHGQSAWVECGSREATDAAHIIRRRHCGEYWDAQELLILACRQCHDIYDGRVLNAAPYRVRVPRHRAQAAWGFLTVFDDFLCKRRVKTDPPARYDPQRNSDYD